MSVSTPLPGNASGSEGSGQVRRRATVRKPVAGQPPDTPTGSMQFAIRQSPDRTRIAGRHRANPPNPTNGRCPAVASAARASDSRHFAGERRRVLPTAPVPGTASPANRTHWPRSACGQIDLRQLIEQCLRFTQMRGAAGHGRHRLRPALGQYREHLMAQVIARELPILVRGVFDPAQPMLARRRPQVRPA